MATNDIPQTRRAQRQARVEAQRQKLETYHRAARLKRLVAIGAIVLATLGAVAAFLMLSGAFKESVAPSMAEVNLGRVVADEGRQHIADGTPVSYRSRPPASGAHFESEAAYAFFEREVPVGNWLHNLEHGGIVVLYRPDLVAGADRDALRTMRDKAPVSRQWRTTKMVVLPYADMDHAVAAVAWNRIDELDAVDTDQILAFYKAYLDKGPEQAV